MDATLGDLRETQRSIVRSFTLPCAVQSASSKLLMLAHPRKVLQGLNPESPLDGTDWDDIAN